MKKFIIFGALFLLLLPSYGFPLQYEIKVIGNLGSNSRAISINDSGTIIGEYFSNDKNNYRAFIYKNGADSDLGIHNEGSIAPKEINNNGEIIGNTSHLGNFLYSGNNTSVLNGQINTRFGNFYSKNVFSINSSGHILGTGEIASWIDGRRFYIGNYIYKNGNFIEIGDDLTGEMLFNDFNDSGVFVGKQSGADFSRALIYKEGKYSPISPIGNYLYFDGTLVNNFEQVVVQSKSKNSIDLFLWENGDLKPVGAFGGNETIATEINDLGKIIGFSKDNLNQRLPFIYDFGNFYNIYDLISPKRSFNFEYLSVYDINNNNQIVGEALINGTERRAVLLTPINSVPEPSTFILFFVGILAWAAKRKYFFNSP